MANRLLFKLISFLRTTLRYVLSLLSFLFFSFSCTPTEPKFLNEELQLHLEDVSCIEAWVTLNTGKIKLPAEIAIYKNNTPVKNILCYGDTLLYIDSLLPSQTYTIQALLKEQGGNQLSVTSNKITVTTMDTTGSIFTWETYAFGDIAGSGLHDVAIIDENNIWAVGTIKIADTSVNGYTTYNAVHWDGNQWNLKRIFFPTVCGSSNLTSYPAQAIFTFNGQIWISSGGDKITILNEGIQTNRFCLPANVSMSIIRIWGINRNDLFLVGYNGSIAHFNGSTWNRIESGTEVMFNSIGGQTKSGELFISGYNSFGEHNSTLIGIKNEKASIIWESKNQLETLPYGYQIFGNYVNNDNLFVISNKGLFSSNIRLKTYPKRISFVGHQMYSITGTGINNIFTLGSSSNIYHYNGISLKRIYFDNYSVNRLNAGASTDKIVVGVGLRVEDEVLRKAIIVVGKKL